MYKDLSDISEKKLQKAVHGLLSEPSTVWKTESDRRIQILSPGRINPFNGPDFSDIAVLLNSNIIIGDAEFHKNSSEWFNHGHHNDENYNSVILHIVVNNDKKIIDEKFETLIIDKNLIINELENRKAIYQNQNLNDVEDLQHYSLLRVIRKTGEAQRILNQNSIYESLIILVSEFINRYHRRRRRPVYDNSTLAELIGKIAESDLLSFLNELEQGNFINIPDRMLNLIKNKILNEGAHLRREIVLNCVLPLALCLANEEARINLFLWYWSTPALHSYGELLRRFPAFSQNFLWQQQGMLEYLKEHGRKVNVVHDSLKEYGFGELLSFYYIGKSPYLA